MTEELNAALVGGFIGVVSAAAIGFFTFRAHAAETRWATTMSFFNEFNGPALVTARNDARDYLKTRMLLSFAELGEAPRPSGEDPRHAHRSVIRFYERLAVMLRCHRLCDQVVLDLFGSIFAWWWKFCLEDQLGRTDWQAASELDDLAEWMRRRASLDGRTPDWERWCARGAKERASFLAGFEQLTVADQREAEAAYRRAASKSTVPIGIVITATYTPSTTVFFTSSSTA
ncbi:DUF4760 domain-containing protein [Caulobacter mirabilis]|uniref:Uncharacterized protein n=1 Tax=Caulobacter mirabilis TaxID=69666 RepID=A0A2D2B0N6_9CAUL|nr:hypothetical protein [Caulobacter mirabilis]ATQ43823.1 hypothetical protein CSW64_16185 [Caulobacter mirabilis]